MTAETPQTLEFAAMPGRGVTLHVARSGPANGPLVILLHGFPEFWYGWRRQIGPLARAGFRVLAPDQRGYNLSEKPKGITHYALDALADDVVALIDASGRERGSIVGHDWGGVVAWWVAIRHRDRVDRLAVLNAPHPEVIVRNLLWKNPAQLARSWYALAMQAPWLPEAGLGALGARPLARLLKASSRPGTFSKDDLARYRRSWNQPGALSSMINWYRAALRAKPEAPYDLRVRMPAFIIWGVKDPALRRKLAADALACCDAGRLEYIEEATHWVQHEEPDRVNRLLVDFLRPPAASPPRTIAAIAGAWLSGDGPPA